MAANVEKINQLSAWCWAQLCRATNDRHSEFRWVNLATLDSDGLPQVRTVVLREVAPTEQRVSFHTDVRSTKITELTTHNWVALHFHSRRLGVQMRMAGRAEFASDEHRRSAWQSLHEGAKITYAQREVPGAKISDPTQLLLDTASTTEDGYPNFVLVHVSIASIDWLELKRCGHRRALLIYQSDDEHTATWLAP
ncbi:MAG: pyridoxamine 5'-phosphate oxidase family protein [Pseudomonadota bacterium]